VKAANMVKLGKQWDEAGQAFMRACDMLLKADSKHEAAGNYVNASNCFRKGTQKEAAVDCLKLAVELFTDEGRFSIAAKHQKEIAEMYEQDNMFKEAAEAYQTAADYYDGEGSTSSANQMMLKVAHYCALDEQYAKAIEIYEDVAKKSLESNLLKWGVKEYFMKAILCHLANNDLVSAQKAYEKYCEMDISFSTTREGKFVNDIMAAVEAYDVDKFTDVVREYDTITKLDQWKTKLLLKTKNLIKSEEDELA